jgi:hypothetical protein
VDFGNGHHSGPLTIGYMVGAGVMVAGGIVAWFFGVNAERTALEDVAPPLSETTEVVGRVRRPRPSQA